MLKVVHLVVDSESATDTRDEMDKGRAVVRVLVGVW